MNSKQTDQMEKWAGDFGRNYTDRNIYGVTELDKFYLNTWGIARSEMNREILNPIKTSIDRILEVGCNVGNQLNALQAYGFNSLYGIELQEYAVEKAKELTKGINIIRGSAFDVPFKDNYFDLVFTSGVLIHISPEDIKKVMREIYRVSRRYIWGFEYYSGNYHEIVYRECKNLLWKGNFAQMYLDLFPDLTLVMEKKFSYIHKRDKMDSMFLLRKV